MTVLLVHNQYIQPGGEDVVATADTSRAQVPEPGLKLLYVGRFLYWKGMHLGLPAFAGLLKSCPEARLTLLGNGPEERRWRKLADHLGISE